MSHVYMQGPHLRQHLVPPQRQRLEHRLVVPLVNAMGLLSFPMSLAHWLGLLLDVCS